jgi:hypothetical protein
MSLELCPLASSKTEDLPPVIHDMDEFHEEQVFELLTTKAFKQRDLIMS